MADVTITNLTTSPLYIGDLYTTIAASSSIVVSRYASDLSRMKSLQDAIAAGNAAVSVAPTANEAASGLLTADASILAADIAPVAATTVASADVEFRQAFTALAAGAQDDVTLFAANALPYKMRIVDCYALVSTIGTGAATLTLRDQAAGAGTAVAIIPSGVTGKINPTAASFKNSVVLTPGATIGLFLRRADRDAAGEIVVRARRET